MKTAPVLTSPPAPLRGREAGKPNTRKYFIEIDNFLVGQ